jgi:hypothetical protein
MPDKRVCEYKPLASRRLWVERTCGTLTSYSLRQGCCSSFYRAAGLVGRRFCPVLRVFRRPNAPTQRTQFFLLSASIIFVPSRCYIARKGRFKHLSRCMKSAGSLVRNEVLPDFRSTWLISLFDRFKLKIARVLSRCYEEQPLNS